jgi:hypothetical protein
MVALRVRCELHAALLDQLGYGGAGPCAALDPLRQALGLELDAGRLLPRIIDAYLLEPTPIPGIPPVSDDDAVERAFLATVSSESNYCSHD